MSCLKIAFINPFCTLLTYPFSFPSTLSERTESFTRVVLIVVSRMSSSIWCKATRDILHVSSYGEISTPEEATAESVTLDVSFSIIIT